MILEAYPPTAVVEIRNPDGAMMLMLPEAGVNKIPFSKIVCATAVCPTVTFPKLSDEGLAVNEGELYVVPLIVTVAVVAPVQEWVILPVCVPVT